MGKGNKQKTSAQKAAEKMEASLIIPDTAPPFGFSSYYWVDGKGYAIPSQPQPHTSDCGCKSCIGCGLAPTPPAKPSQTIDVAALLERIENLENQLSQLADHVVWKEEKE